MICIAKHHTSYDQGPFTFARTAGLMIVAGVLMRFTRGRRKVDPVAVHTSMASPWVKAVEHDHIRCVPTRAMQQDLLVHIRLKWLATVETALAVRHDTAIDVVEDIDAIEIQ